jgi:hypothetical protein
MRGAFLCTWMFCMLVLQEQKPAHVHGIFSIQKLLLRHSWQSDVVNFENVGDNIQGICVNTF